MPFSDSRINSTAGAFVAADACAHVGTMAEVAHKGARGGAGGAGYGGAGGAGSPAAKSGKSKDGGTKASQGGGGGGGAGAGAASNAKSKKQTEVDVDSLVIGGDLPPGTLVWATRRGTSRHARVIERSASPAPPARRPAFGGRVAWRPVPHRANATMRFRYRREEG